MTATKEIIESIVHAARIDTKNTMSTDMLVESLQQAIYAQYSRGDVLLPEEFQQENKNFIDELRHANKTAERWDTNWTVSSVDSAGACHIKKGNYSRRAYPGEFIKESFYHGATREGDKLRLLARKESYEDGQPFYFMFGETIGEDHQQFQFRFYFNVAYDGASKLVEAITSSFNDYSIPFQFKCMALANGYQRADTAVMYLDKRYFKVAVDIIRHIHPKLEKSLRPGCPLFTRRMAHGWSFAESPLNANESFGSNRAHLLARLIVDCFNTGIDPLLWPNEVITRIEKVGHDIERFYLNAESRFPYHPDNNE